MEYVAGTDLRQRMRGGRISLPEAVRIVCQISDALQYAHDAGLVHRDIKPANILLDQVGRVKVAKLLTNQTAGNTLTGPLGGAACDCV
jgi:serine/threonine protein kinase